MKIAFLTVGNPARLTGGYLYHREVFARLRAAGVEITELVVAGASLAEQLVAAPGLGARFDPRPFDALVVDALARAVCAPWLDGWRAIRPLVAMVHELPAVAAGSGPQEAQELAFEAPLLRADRLIAVSDDGARILAGRGAPPERIVVASGGLDRLRAHWRPSSPPPAPDADPPSMVLCVAQWIPRKGVLELARAWAQVARPGWRLELVGETEPDPAYAGQVRAALAVAPPWSVVVRGPLSDAVLAEAYQSATLFALPSHYEGYGIAFAEALAAGLPVVGCAVGPVPALVGPEAGLLVPVGDEPALVAAFSRLIEDASLRERMGRAALAQAARLPTWDDCAAAFKSAVDAAIAERQGAPESRPDTPQQR